MSGTNRANATFEGVQALRLIAALMVLITHSTFYMATRTEGGAAVWHAGAQGVSIFFVISGFVMIVTAGAQRNSSPSQFIIGRLIRVVPLYWAVSLIKLAVWLVIPALVFASPDINNLILSFLFLPSFNAERVIEPFYGVGWTLNFEMFFYVLFAIALWLRMRIVWSVGVVLILLSIGSIFREPQWIAPAFYLNSEVLNFLYGMVIGRLVQSGLRVPTLLALSLILLGTVITLFPPEVPLLGLQYACLVGGVVFAEASIKGRVPAIIMYGGNASYAVYLIHPLVGPAVAVILRKVQHLPPHITVLGIVILSLIAGAIVHSVFERPVTSYLKNLVKRPRLAWLSTRR